MLRRCDHAYGVHPARLRRGAMGLWRGALARGSGEGV